MISGLAHFATFLFAQVPTFMTSTIRTMLVTMDHSLHSGITFVALISRTGAIGRNKKQKLVRIFFYFYVCVCVYVCMTTISDERLLGDFAHAQYLPTWVAAPCTLETRRRV